MKILLSILIFISIGVSAQNNLVVFTQESKPFYVIINGIRQNMDAETNVKIKNLPGDFYRVKVVFADGKTPDADKSVSFMEKNHEYSMEVRGKKGKYKLRFAGMRPISESDRTATTIAYHEEEIVAPPPTNNSGQSSTQNGTQTQSKVNTQVNQTNSTVNTQSEGINSSISTNTTENGSVNVNVDMNENGVSMNINVPEGQINNEHSTTIEQGNSSQSTINETTVEYSFSGSGSMCSSPNVSNKDYLDFKYVLENANMFKRQELIIAYFQSHCMLSNQVAGLIKLNYSTIDAKKIAKEGYRYTYDTENYGLVIEALNSPSDQSEVLTFLGAGSVSNSSTTSQSSSINNQNTQINSTVTTTINSSNSGQNPVNSQVNQQSNNTQQTQFSQLLGYTGYVNCNGVVISNVDEIVNKASKEPFSDDQRKVIESLIGSRCVSADQVAQLATAFAHEGDQLSFMKWAFNRTYDIDNFYKLSSQLTFNSSKEELDKFIDEQPTGHFTYVYSSANNDGFLIDDADLKKRMEAEAFSDDQLALAKQALVSRYISVSQVKSIMNVFSHESDVLKFLELAYPRTTDQENFGQLREKLTFDSNKKAFDKITE